MQHQVTHFDPEVIDGDGQSRPASLAPLIADEPEHGRPLTGVLVCTASVVVSLTVLLWGAGQLARLMLSR